MALDWTEWQSREISPSLPPPFLPSGMSAICQELIIYLYTSFINLEEFLSGGSCFPLEIQAI